MVTTPCAGVTCHLRVGEEPRGGPPLSFACYNAPGQPLKRERLPVGIAP